METTENQASSMACCLAHINNRELNLLFGLHVNNREPGQTAGLHEPGQLHSLTRKNAISLHNMSHFMRKGSLSYVICWQQWPRPFCISTLCFQLAKSLVAVQQFDGWDGNSQIRLLVHRLVCIFIVYISRVERKTIVTQTYFWNPCLGATWTSL